MATQALILDAVGERNRPSFIIDHNPFYLLSGLCMMMGCFAIFSQIHGKAEDVGKLLTLLGVFEVYGLSVVALGLFLARQRRPGLARDAGYLLVLTCLLMVDATFLYNEAFTAHAWLGLATNALAAGLALVKLALMARVLGVRFARPAWVVIGLEIVLLFTMPGAFRALRRAEALSGVSIYAAWWLAGLVIVAHTGPWMRSADEQAGGPSRRTLQGVVRATMVTLPLVSVLGHLLAVHFVHDRPFFAANLGPVLLAGAIVWVHQFARPGDCCRRDQVVPAALALAAVVVSLHFPEVLVFRPDGPGGIALSPLRLMLFGGAAACGYVWWWHDGAWLLGWIMLQTGMGVAGHTTAQIRPAFERLWSIAAESLRQILPRTVMDWGIVAVVASFALLGAGAAVSMLKRRGESDRVTDVEEMETMERGGVRD